MGRSDSVNKNRRAAARHGRTDAGQARTEVQGLVSPSYMQPFAIACRTTRDPTYVRGNLSRKGDLSLHLVSQSEYSSALFIIHGGLGIQASCSLRRRTGSQSPCLCGFHLLPSGPSPGGSGSYQSSHFVLSELLTSKMETLRFIVQFKKPYGRKQMLFIEHL